MCHRPCTGSIVSLRPNSELKRPGQPVPGGMASYNCDASQVVVYQILHSTTSCCQPVLDELSRLKAKGVYTKLLSDVVKT